MCVYFGNRAACFLKLNKYEAAIEDATKAVDLDGKYLKGYMRRAQAYEATDKLSEALKDYQKVLELDPTIKQAQDATKILPSRIQEKMEREKAEMLGKCNVKDS